MEHKFVWNLWTAIGLFGQAFFFARFFVQWIASERRKVSVIPTAFWFFSLAGSVVLLSRDVSGRVQSRRVLSADGSRVATATEYWPHTDVARRSVEEAVDPAGRPTRRTVQEFDQRGRLLERRAVSIDTAGKERGSRTRYNYDARGQRSATTSPVER